MLQHETGQPALAEATVVPGRQPEVTRPASYGWYQDRASAPAAADIDQLSHRFEVVMPSTYLSGQEATVEIEWAGDVAVVVVDGQVLADRFWDGSVWELDAVDLGLGSGFEIWIVPLHRDAAVWVPEPAQRRRDASTGDLAQLGSVRVRSYGTWAVLR